MHLYQYLDVAVVGEAQRSHEEACNSVLPGWQFSQVADQQLASKAFMLTDSKGLGQAASTLPDYWFVLGVEIVRNRDYTKKNNKNENMGFSIVERRVTECNR